MVVLGCGREHKQRCEALSVVRPSLAGDVARVLQPHHLLLHERSLSRGIRAGFQLNTLLPPAPVLFAAVPREIRRDASYK